MTTKREFQLLSLLTTHIRYGNSISSILEWTLLWNRLLMNKATTQIKIHKMTFQSNVHHFNFLRLNLFSTVKLSIRTCCSLIWICLLQTSSSNSLILFTNFGRINWDLGSISSLSLHRKKWQLFSWKNKKNILMLLTFTSIKPNKI